MSSPQELSDPVKGPKVKPCFHLRSAEVAGVAGGLCYEAVILDMICLGVQHVLQHAAWQQAAHLHRLLGEALEGGASRFA